MKPEIVSGTCFSVAGRSLRNSNGEGASSQRGGLGESFHYSTMEDPYQGDLRCMLVDRHCFSPRNLI